MLFSDTDLVTAPIVMAVKVGSSPLLGENVVSAVDKTSQTFHGKVLQVHLP